MVTDNTATKAALAQATANIDIALGDLNDLVSPSLSAVLLRVFKMDSKGVRVTDAARVEAFALSRAAWAVVAAVAELDEAITRMEDAA